MQLVDSNLDSVMNNLQKHLRNMEKNNKKHAAELDSFNTDSRSYNECENHFTYDILKDMFLSEKDENTHNESELEMKGFLFEGSKITVLAAMVLILSYFVRFSLSSVDVA